MKNILLVCSTGVTSAKIVSEMKHAAISRAEEYLKIWSVGVAGVKDEVAKADIILLSPQSAYLKETIEELIDDKKILKDIPADVYASLDGKAIIDFALE